MLYRIDPANRDDLALEVKRLLKSGGKLLIIDWTPGGEMSPETVIPQVTAEGLFQKVGFVLEKSFDAGDHHYGIILKRI
jgi:ubiquinone/menaquinone biosynthesis C-methylase UbiE